MNIIKEITNSANIFISNYKNTLDMNTCPTNIIERYFKKSLELYLKLKRHENIDDFCENEAFGLLFSTTNDSMENRRIYTNKLKAYIIANHNKKSVQY